MSGIRRCQFSTVIYMSVFALVVNNLSAQNSVHFYTSSPPVSTTEQASVVVEQHEVASGRSIRGGSFRQTNQNNYNNPNERPLRTTGFAFKGRNSFGDDGQTSPIPFLIPSYASGIIFRNSDNDRSPQVEIQPSIHVASKTIGPEEEEEEEQQSATASNGNRGGIDSTRTRTTITTTTPSTYRRTRPTSNVNLANSFERRTFTPLQTTSFRASTVTQSSIVQNEIQNNSPMQSALTTLSPPFAPSQIHTRPTIDKATQQPRFADITKRIEVLGLQAPGYAIRTDGTIDSDALPPNFVVNTNTNFASNNLNPLDFDTAASTTTTQMSFTTTPRVTRTTKPFQQHFLPTAFIPSNDNPFLPHRQSKQQNLNATPAPFTSFQSSGTQTTNTFKGSTTFATTTLNNRRNQHARGNGFTTSFAPPQTSAKSSAFSKTGINQHSPTGQFANQPNSRQSKSHNELSFNAQQQAQRKNSQIVLDLDNRARLPPFGITETTPFPTLPAAAAAASSSSFGGFTTKRVQSFANSPIPTAKAPAGFSFAAFAKTTPRPRIVATTNAPTTFSTIFPSKYTFSTIPTTNAPAQLAQSDESPPLNAAAAPSIELLPPITSNTADAKSAFAPINEAGALVRPKSPAFSAGTTNRNQQQHHPKNNIKPFNAPPKVNNGFTAFPTTTTTRRPIITTTTRSPIRHRPTFSTTPFKFTTTTARPTTTAAAITTTPFASFHHQNQPSVQAQLPYTDLLPPIESDSQTKESVIVPSTNSFVQQLSASISLPNDDLLPPLSAASDAQAQNSHLPNAAPNSIHTANENDASVAGAAHIKASAITTSTKTKTDHQPNSGLDLNPFLPPVDAVAPNAPAATNANANTESNSEHNNNDYTTITLEQNPFLPQLDLNPFLPPFVFTPSENDPGFGFGAGTPPPKDEDSVDDDANAS